MIDPMNVAAVSISVDVARLTSISQNLVNAATPGYRREVSFTKVLQQQNGGIESMTAATAVDQRLGTLRATGDEHDLAIDGEGFFELRTPEGWAYTRRGDFKLDSQGQLVNSQGYALQGVAGSLQLAPGPVQIDHEGVLTQNGQRIGQIKVVKFDRPQQLTRLPGGMFQAGEAPQTASAGDSKIRQGFLEASNVDTAAEMVRLMETMRHFEATQKMVQSVDDMTERAFRKLGEF